MDSGRRSFLGSVVPAALVVGTAVANAQSRQQQPPRPGQPEEPKPPDLKPDARLLLKQNQKDIKRDVQRLFELAEDLKKEVEKTDSVEVLSIPLLRKVEEIEKLARHIRSLARG